jgi:hypothetical protein
MIAATSNPTPVEGAQMIVTLDLQVADTPCVATINTATKTVVEVTTAEDPAFADLKVAQAMGVAGHPPEEIAKVTGWPARDGEQVGWSLGA